MASFFFEFGLFALKAITVVALLAGALGIIVAMLSRSAGVNEDHFEITKLNDRVNREKDTLRGAVLDDAAWEFRAKEKRAEEKAERKSRKKLLKAASKSRESASLTTTPTGGRPRVYVVEFEGDLQASAVSSLRREITAILAVAETSDEVVVRLESGGGLVHSYGLAASQLQRIRNAGVRLTVCVDRVAASGGYMMACVANQIIAAPFAVIGSIGVVAQIPNFHRLLKKNDVDLELITAGEHKRTLTMLGENTEKGREKFRHDMEETHGLFKEFVKEHRPGLDVDRVATGEVWWGTRAVAMNLVDAVSTSDDYISNACEKADVLEVHFKGKKTLQERLMATVEASAERVLGKWWERASRQPLL